MLNAMTIRTKALQVFQTSYMVFVHVLYLGRAVMDFDAGFAMLMSVG
jgi:hypothetical protein